MSLHERLLALIAKGDKAVQADFLTDETGWAFWWSEEEGRTGTVPAEFDGIDLEPKSDKNPYYPHIFTGATSTFFVAAANARPLMKKLLKLWEAADEIALRARNIINADNQYEEKMKELGRERHGYKDMRDSAITKLDTLFEILKELQE